MARAKALAAWKARVQQAWPKIRVEVLPDGDPSKEVLAGSKVRARARVVLGDLTSDDVAVELYLGCVDGKGDIVEGMATRMEPVAGQVKDKDGSSVFEAGAAPCRRSGQHGYTIRVVPRHPDLAAPFIPGLIVWAK